MLGVPPRRARLLRRVRRPGSPKGSGLLLAVLLAAAAVVVGLHGATVAAVPLPAPSRIAFAPPATSIPAPTVTSAPQPARSPTPVASATTSTLPAPAASLAFAFRLVNRDGTPVRWNPCAPIHYVTNLADAPPGAAQDLATALHMVTAATGIVFVDDGPTTERPTLDRPVDEPERYPGGHAPVLISWTTRSETDVFGAETGTAYGTTNVSWLDPPGSPDADPAYVSGELTIDPRTTAGLAPGFGAGPSIGELLLHELGHLMGLAHVADPSQIMYPTLLPVAARYGAGDLAGLARLGWSAGCLPLR